MKNLLILCLVLLGVAAQAQKKAKVQPVYVSVIDALRGLPNENMRTAFMRLNIPFDDKLIADNVAKMEKNNSFVGQMDAYYRVPVLKLWIYVDKNKLESGGGLLRSDWVVVCQIHKVHPQDYFTHPTTKKVYGRYTSYVPQFLVPDFEAYVPTPAELEKVTVFLDREAVRYGFYIYRPASAATKKACKARL